MLFRSTAREVRERGLDASIFMLVHDSIVAVVKTEQVEQYCDILRKNTQHEWGCNISGCAIGVDQDIGDDYSFGHFEETYKLDNNQLARI